MKKKYLKLREKISRVSNETIAKAGVLGLITVFTVIVSVAFKVSIY